MQFRIRTKWLNANLMRIVLLALRAKPMSEWELLDDIYGKSDLMPDSDEFKRTIQLLLEGGFVELMNNDRQPLVSVNNRGLELLSELEGVQNRYFEHA